MTMTATTARIMSSREDELKTMLEELRRELVNEVHAKIRDARAESGHSGSCGCDEGEASDLDIREEIEFTLIEMKTETLGKIGTALRRIDEGTYGVCFECGDEIAGARLQALPFAVRCKNCEESREVAERRERITARRNSSSALSEGSTG